MSLAQRVAGIVANFLGEKDEQQVLTEVLAPAVERFDYASVKPPAAERAAHPQNPGAVPSQEPSAWQFRTAFPPWGAPEAQLYVASRGPQKGTNNIILV